MKIKEDERRRLLAVMAALQADRRPFWYLWRELADYFLPKRYVWLETDKEARIKKAKNPFILDSTGTISARILASGMMNGITSPARPWFSLRVPGYDDDGGPVTQWCDEVTRRMLQVFSESNFYNSIAVLYLDLVIFGSAAQLIYEDYETVIRCYNPALGEFYLGQDYRLQVNSFAREYTQTVQQCVARWGEEHCSESVRRRWKEGGAQALSSVKISHLIEPNLDGKTKVPKMFEYRETYWESGCTDKELVLSQRGFHEMPGIFPRWDLTANDSYGTSPAMDALPDVIQLQQETKRKAQGLDKTVSPPVVADIQLQHRPTALLPNGITYVAGVNNVGAKPLYQISLPLDAMTADIRDVRERIQEVFHNPLFNMISQLDTVRSATEIDARKEEKLVLLGPVLERFENEALDPAIARTFSIMGRAKLLPPPPPEVNGRPLAIQYVSILSTAQRAVSAIPTERWIGLIGNIAGVAPQVTRVPNWEELVRNYGISIGVQARDMNTREEVQAIAENEAQRQQAAEMAAAGAQVAQGAKTLSETDVGGGANALQQVLGGMG